MGDSPSVFRNVFFFFRELKSIEMITITKRSIKIVIGKI